MLDESMFEDIHEIAENNAYLKAVEDKSVSLDMLDNLPPYSACADMERRLAIDGQLTFESVFHSNTGFYLFSCFLVADYAVDKAIFIKDVEAFRRMRFESARKRIALLIYNRFVSNRPQEQTDWNTAFSQYLLHQSSQHLTNNQMKTISVFTVAQNIDERITTSGTTLAHASISQNNISANEMVPAVINPAAREDGATSVANQHTFVSATTIQEHTAVGQTTAYKSNAYLVSTGNATETSSIQPSKYVPSSSASPHNRSTHTATTISMQHKSSIHDAHSTRDTTNTLNVPTSESVTQFNSDHGMDDENSKPSRDDANTAASTFLSIGTCNSVGVFGKAVARIRSKIRAGQAPADLFDALATEVYIDLKLDAFPRFLMTSHYQRYVRTKFIETQRVNVIDFTTFRVLGRGGFGAVHACRKKNSGAILAMKAINKKLVKVKSALDNVLEERNVLTMMKSHFVTNLKYALQDEETLYLIMDLMLGGDLKFHLINAGRFTEKRARFYAAQVLLGLESLHKMSIVYRDMKLENVLLDERGHCKISDMGLAVVTRVKIKGYAGTPGYTAPEMIKNKLYGTSIDIFSFGVMLYRMLCGSKPFKGKIDRELDKAVIEKKPIFPKELFSKEASHLLTGLLQKKPEMRIGCVESQGGISEIKAHPFFESVDWGLLEAGYIDSPFVPNKFDVNAASLKDIGDFDRTKYKTVKLDERFKQRIKGFEWANVQALQEEMVAVLEKADQNQIFEKFKPKFQQQIQQRGNTKFSCCTLS